MVNPVYNYLISTYVPKTNNRHDSHQPKDLKELYSQIVKKNKLSPLYKIQLTNAQQSNVITMKDTALYMKSALSALDFQETDSVFSYRKAYSSEPECAEVVISDQNQEDLPDAFTFKVNQLAASQINHGRSMRKQDAGISSGKYSFAININDYDYSFDVSISPGATNEEILSELANTINNADIGVRAYIQPEGDRFCSLNLESVRTGTDPNQNYVFSIKDTSAPNSGQNGLIGYYGLGLISQTPKNAVFEINGVKGESASNEFHMNHSLKITLHAPSESEFLVGYMNDGDKISEGLNHLKDCYNTLIDLTSDEADGSLSKKLSRELHTSVSGFRNDLESSGITFSEDGHMEVDSFVALQSTATGDLQALFQNHSDFIQRFNSRIHSITLDPMEYINKKIVTYPNTSRPGFNNPYQTSIYSGLLFNYYC